ncbi:MAG TPA: ester cyclase [Mycobacteriales bacterium]|jgi:predicted ester cyclase|nr:ester cyclase [Mycobacteriales bacterium]
MSNKDTIRRMFDEVINLGKIDMVDDLFHPDFRTVTPQGTFDREGFKGYVTAWRNGFADIHCEVGDLIEEGDRIAWSVRATGTHTGDFNGIPATGRSVDFASLNIAEFRGGLGYRHTVLMNDLAVMAQLGLLPEPPAA